MTPQTIFRDFGSHAVERSDQMKALPGFTHFHATITRGHRHYSLIAGVRIVDVVGENIRTVSDLFKFRCSWCIQVYSMYATVHIETVPVNPEADREAEALSH